MFCYQCQRCVIGTLAVRRPSRSKIYALNEIYALKLLSSGLARLRTLNLRDAASVIICNNV